MSNSAIVGILRALLTADTATFNAALKRSGESAKAWSKDLGKIGQDATRLGASLTKALTLPILGIGVGAAKLAIDFESSFAGVRKTVTATEAEFDAMAQSFRDLAKEIPVNVNELNRLGEAAGALGIPKAEVVDFARVMALLGVTTNVTADQAAESIAKIQNIFGAAGKDTERFASTLVALGNNGASTESQILEMATRIAGAGNTIGLTQGQVLGFASALSSVGLEAEAGGTAISRVFVDIAKAVSDGGQSLADFAKVSGMTSAQFTTAFKTDAAEAVSAFVDGLGRVKTSGGDLLKTLAALGFSEVRVRDTLLRAAGAGDLLRTSLDLQKTAWVANTALTAEAGKRFETTSAQLTLLWNRVKDVGVTIGNVLLPVIQGAITFVNGLIPTIDFLGKTFAALPVPLKLAAVGVGLVLAAAGPVIFVFGQLAIASSALTGAFTATGLASRVLSASLLGLNVAGAASWLLTLVTRLGLLSAGFVAGAGAAVLHEQALARLIEVGKDLERVDREIIIKELELATALDNTNDKQAQKLQTELKALKSGRDQALQQKARLESETRAAKAVADGAKQDLGKADALATLTEAQKKHREEIEKLRDDLTGKRLADDVRDLQAAYNLLTPAQRENLSVMTAFTAKADELGDKGARLTPQLQAMREALRQQVPEWNVASEAARRYLAEIDKATNETKVSFLPGLGLTKEKSFFDQFPINTETPSKPRTVADIMADADAAAAAEAAAVRRSVDDMAKSFAQLAQVAGGSMGSVLRSVGTGITAMQTFQTITTNMANNAGSTIATVAGVVGIYGLALAGAEALNSTFESGAERFMKTIGKLNPLMKELQSLAGDEAIKAFKKAWLTEDFMFDEGDQRRAVKAIKDQVNGIKDLLASFELAAKKTADSLITIGASTQKISAGFGSTIARSFDDATKAQLKAFDEQLTAAQGHEDEIEAIEAQREAFITQTNAAIVANTQVEFDRLSRITLASFNAQIANGKSTIEAVQLLGPAIDTLIASADRFGFAGSAAFDQLARWRTLTVENAPLLDQLGGLNELMWALDNVGALTAETFKDLKDQGLTAFEQLTAAGFTEREALQQISPLLDSIIRQSKEHGWAIDDETQKLIDAAEADGLLRASQLSTNEILQQGLGEIITLLGGDLPDAWKKMAQAAKMEIQTIGSAADGLSRTLRDQFTNMPFGFAADGAMPNMSGWPSDFRLPDGAQTSPLPSFQNHPLERVTREGLAMLHPGDVVGVPPQGFGSDAALARLASIDNGLARLPIAVRDAVLTSGRRR